MVKLRPFDAFSYLDTEERGPDRTNERPRNELATY